MGVSDVESLLHRWLTNLEVSHFTFEKCLENKNTRENSRYRTEFEADLITKLLLRAESISITTSINVAEYTPFDAASIEPSKFYGY